MLQKIWHRSAFYKAQAVKNAEFNKLSIQKMNLADSLIIKDVFDDKYIVQNGAFKGMKYISRATGSALLPKILGSYEEPIQDWIQEVLVKKNYSSILDIGCAEGYYACGFAMCLPNTQIIAYDIDLDARNNCSELKLLNGLQNIKIKAECSHSELDNNSKAGTLVFCDMEGFEEKLLDPKKVPNLQFVDLLIESHDCFVPNLSEILIERFYKTHSIRIVVDYPFRIKKYNTPNTASAKQFDYIVNEHRPDHMKFMFMETISGKI
ncbi:conserved protein of unknown function [Candidatus Methylopumilus turicensis]|uniref:Methyltransferase domain-containing protein n=1 Tax=Candidatus Methylopumilus turicensis TaxID=1581680 RepID=A0A0B7IUL5_9PROT|nr:conserved protein of unknown function [Candidatus Methylopumilus turicensis]